MSCGAAAELAASGAEMSGVWELLVLAGKLKSWGAGELRCRGWGVVGVGSCL